MRLVLVLCLVAGVSTYHDKYEAKQSQYEYGGHDAQPTPRGNEGTAITVEDLSNDYLDIEEDIIWEHILNGKSRVHKAKENQERKRTTPMEQSDDYERIKENFRKKNPINEVLRYTIKSRRAEVKDNVVKRRSTLGINAFADNNPYDTEDYDIGDNNTIGEGIAETIEKAGVDDDYQLNNPASEFNTVKTSGRKHSQGKHRRGLQPPATSEIPKHKDEEYDDVKRLKKYEQKLTMENETSSMDATTSERTTERSNLRNHITTINIQHETLDDEQQPIDTVRQVEYDYFLDATIDEISTGVTPGVAQDNDTKVHVMWLHGPTPPPSAEIREPEETKNVPFWYLEKAKKILTVRLLNESLRDIWISTKRDILVCGYIEMSELVDASSTVRFCPPFVMFTFSVFILLN